MAGRIPTSFCLMSAAMLSFSAPAAVRSSSTEESDAITRTVMQAQAAFQPEKFSALGMSEFDDDVMDLGPQLVERSLASNQKLVALLEAQRARTRDPALLADLDILGRSLRQDIQTAQLNRQYLLPYCKVPEILFLSFRALLDVRIDRGRRVAALVRLQRYIGQEHGYAPLTDRAIERSEERLTQSGLIGPYRAEVERDLANVQRFKDGLAQLFAQSGLDGWQDDLAVLQTQLQAYSDWVRTVMLPRVRRTVRFRGASMTIACCRPESMPIRLN